MDGERTSEDHGGGYRRPDAAVAARREAVSTGSDRKERHAAQHGQGMVEYALILVLVAVVVIVALTALGGQIQGVFHTITSTLNTANH